MKLLSVGLTGTTDEVRARLQQDCKVLIQDGFKVTIDEIIKGGYTFLGCNIIEGEMSFRNYEKIKNLLKKYIANLLADVIVLREEKYLIRKIIKQKYNYFSSQEQDLVYDKAIALLDGNESWLNDFSPAIRRGKIIARLLEYLDNHHELVVDGFVAFRLKDYRQKLGLMVDKAVDDFMMELEYKEFIRVLKYFVDFQESRVEQVHVIFQGNDFFRILDNQYKIINNEYLEHVPLKNASEINYEDLLISTLITIAPRMIILHDSKQQMSNEFTDTIKSVFEGRVLFCEGCDICVTGSMGNFTPNKQ